MKKRPVRRNPLSVHFADADERRRLVDLARRERRSISNLVQKFIREGLEREAEAQKTQAG